MDVRIGIFRRGAVLRALGWAESHDALAMAALTILGAVLIGLTVYAGMISGGIDEAAMGAVMGR